MKKHIYISLFIILGLIAQLLVHAVIELWYIGMLVRDISVYGLGLGWDAWFMIHQIFTVILFVGGAVLGWWQGRYWWPRLYTSSGERRKK